MAVYFWVLVYEEKYLNPGPADYESEETLNELWTKYKKQYLEWLSSKKIGERTRKDYLSALTKLFDKHTIKLDHRMIKKTIAAEGNKRNYANALRSFLTFLSGRFLNCSYWSKSVEY